MWSRGSTSKSGRTRPSVAGHPAFHPSLDTPGDLVKSIKAACDNLSALSPEHREIIDLVYYHQKSVRDVAAIVGIPPNTVKTRMFYARGKLAQLLATQGLMRASA